MPRTWKISFAENRPDLAPFVKPEHNNGKSAHEFGSASRGEIVLTCPKCNTNKSNKITVYAAKRKDGKWRAGFTCVYCNSVASKASHLLKEWHPTKNEFSPFEIFANSKISVWWRCEKGHEWEVNPNNRVARYHGCPKCNLSLGESIIMKWLQEADIEFIPQYHATVNGVKRFFDFYIPEEKLFVEVHGRQHFEDCDNYFDYHDVSKQIAIDKQKQTYAEANGKYIMVDYREANPELALDRFIDLLAELA